MLCEYGCGQEAKYTLKNGKECCSEKYQQCPNLKAKNSAGKKKNWEDGVMRLFTDEDRTKSNKDRVNISIKKAFVKNSSYSNEFVKPKFIEYYTDEYKCFECGISEWNDKPIVLELEHSDGDNRNNLVENLKLLCPNCHSQTDTFRGRNINSGKYKATDENLVEAIKTSANIRQALIKVGLSPKGANYDRVKRLKKFYDL